jgi:hypothetical protein
LLDREQAQLTERRQALPHFARTAKYSDPMERNRLSLP